MFGLFNKEKSDSEPEWYPQMLENKERWFTFLEKLEDKMTELCTDAIPALKESFDQDADIYKRVYGKMLSGVQGQLEQMREKANGVKEEKVADFVDNYSDYLDFQNQYRKKLYEFRTECYDRYNVFDEKYSEWREKIAETSYQDYEIEYQQVLDEYEAIKNNFNCKQCGSGIYIDQIYFITTYLTCSSCQTQNTYEPSTKTRGLEQLGRSLAEQRTQHLLVAHQNSNSLERELYFKIHENRISHIDSSAIKSEKEKQNAIWEQERQNAIEEAPILYKKYVRAMFDEWNKIVPQLTEQNEKFYLSWMESA